MKNKIELNNFIKHCFKPSFFFRTFFFIINKLNYRLISKIISKNYYPDSVNKILRKINKQKKTIYSKNKRNYEFSSCEIILCSEKFAFNKESDWHLQFDDQEYTFALHRWNWLMTSFDESPLRLRREWGLHMIRSWIANMMDSKNNFAWHPYTVGERISNGFLFGALTNGNQPKIHYADILPNDIKESINYMTFFLSKNLEYKGKGKTGNHIINNSRALLYASILLENNLFSELSFSILKSDLDDLISKDGFLREGSSHYQFIFSRWILEMIWLAKISNNDVIYNYLIPFANKLIKQCNFFIIDKSNVPFSIPLIGDISPDFPVSWLTSLPFSSLANEVIDESENNINFMNTNFDWSFLVNQNPNIFNTNFKN